MHLRIVLLTLAILCAAHAQQPHKITKTKIVDGIYQFITAGYGDVGLDGNSTVIISNDGVLVFDTNCVPSTAEAILKEIRQLTDQPVKYVVNSHWHWDHWSGNQVYKAAFPNVQIITHTKTRFQMINVSLPRNKETMPQLKAHIASLEKALAKAKEENNQPRAARIEQLLLVDKKFLAEKESLTYTFPNVTFNDSMTIHLGNRQVELMHARAITPGDTFLYLPNEKIVVTGDIILDPIPFAAGGCFPADWLAALRRLSALDFEIMIPGHGEAKKGKEFLGRYIELFQTLSNDVRDAKAKGSTAGTIAKTIGDQSDRYAKILGLTDPQAIQSLRPYFIDIYAIRAFAELDHPLSDMPDETSR